MKTDREKALESLRGSLTPEQVSQIQLVVRQAEAVGSWHYTDDTGSVYTTELDETLGQLAKEFAPIQPDA